MSAGFLLHEKFAEVCKRSGQKIAFTEMFSGKSFTYETVYTRAENAASWLLNTAVERSSKVALILDNGALWSIIYFGIVRSGSTVVPIDVKLSELEVYNLLTDSQAEVVFTSEKWIPFFEKSLPSLTAIKRIVIADAAAPPSPFVALDDVFKTQDTAREFPRCSLDDSASIIYTSGTTDKPKGVVLTHKNFSSNYQSLEKLDFCHEDDCFLSILPLHHVFAFTATLLFPFFLGATVAYPKSLKSEDILECLHVHSVTVFMGVPELYTAMHKSIFGALKKQPVVKQIVLKALLNLLWWLRRNTGINYAQKVCASAHQRFGGKLRYFVSGGAKLNPQVARDFFKLGFTILEGYGLTETAPVVSFNMPGKYKIGSVGSPVDGVTVKIDTTGEILIQGDNVMQGYYKNPEQTNQVIKNGWFYSGDMGEIDRNGFISITGRLKEMIVLSSGKNIYPEEIEGYFNKSSFIQEICVLSARNKEGNDVLAAVIVPDFEYFKQIKDANINRKIKWELENFSARLPSYKRITDFVIVSDELPKTRLGKLKRYQVQEVYQEHSTMKQESVEQAPLEKSAEDQNILQTAIGQKALQVLKESLDTDRDITLDDHLELDLGFDSLARVELGLGLENEFGIEIPEAVIDEVFTVGELIAKLNELLLSDEAAMKRSKISVSWSDLLAVVPPEEQMRRINFTPGVCSKLFTLIVSKAMYVLFKIYFRIRVEGRENLPTSGAYVLCPNHTSYLDGMLIAFSVPYATELNLYFLGDRNIFEHFSLRWVLRAARMVPIDPTKEMMNTLQIASHILHQSKLLCIFPEGLRSMEGKPTEFKKGVGILAKELLVSKEPIKIIPVAIKGSFQAWPRTRRIPRPYPIKVVFGSPCEVATLLEQGKAAGIKDDYQAIATAIEKQVEQLFYKP
ncbi:AMP-binding protein [Candidatus Omnitrophota bacterium]